MASRRCGFVRLTQKITLIAIAPDEGILTGEEVIAKENILGREPIYSRMVLVGAKVYE